MAGKTTQSPSDNKSSDDWVAVGNGTYIKISSIDQIRIITTQKSSTTTTYLSITLSGRNEILTISDSATILKILKKIGHDEAIKEYNQIWRHDVIKFDKHGREITS
jgi:hypothetical protein